MYISISKLDFHEVFRRFERNNFSYEALDALYYYFEECEESTGEKIELDVISLCCDYSEEPIKDVLDNYNLSSLEELQENTTVIWHDNKKVLYLAY